MAVRVYGEILKLLRTNKVPVLFLKFDELKAEPKQCLHQVFKFLLNVNDLSGTVVEKRIDDVIDMGSEAT